MPWKRGVPCAWSLRASTTAEHKGGEPRVPAAETAEAPENLAPATARRPGGCRSLRLAAPGTGQTPGHRGAQAPRRPEARRGFWQLPPSEGEPWTTDDACHVYVRRCLHEYYSHLTSIRFSFCLFFSDCLGRDVTVPAACVLRSGWDIAVTPGSESEFEKHALAEGRTVSKRKYKHCMNMLTLKKWSLLT